MSGEKLKILVIGAHPDDCDISAGGTAALYRQLGHSVHFVSVTNGESGHHRIKGQELADIRRAEAQAAGELLGIKYTVLNHRDGYFEPSIEARLEIIKLIRTDQPDLVLTHRPNDYHPDHRYTSQTVCDAAYMITVPNVAPEVPALRVNPVIAYMRDDFQRPYPFSPTVVVDIEPVIESVVDMMDCHKSQFYDWLPYNMRLAQDVPEADSERRAWLGEQHRIRIAHVADKYRSQLIETYGEEHGSKVRYAEAFEHCEYGAPLSPSAIKRLFPFLG